MTRSPDTLRRIRRRRLQLVCAGRRRDVHVDGTFTVTEGRRYHRRAAARGGR